MKKGRPKKLKAQRMSGEIHVRTTATERAELQAAADRDGRALSAWVRWTALQMARTGAGAGT